MKKLLSYCTILFLIAGCSKEEDVNIEMNPFDPASGISIIEIDSAAPAQFGYDIHFTLHEDYLSEELVYRFVIFRDGEILNTQFPDRRSFNEAFLQSGQFHTYEIAATFPGGGRTKKSPVFEFQVP